MKELVIFCESYSLIKNCLYLVRQDYQKRSIAIVIPGNRDLFKFFGEIKEKFFDSSVNIIYFEAFEGGKTAGGTMAQIIYRIPEIVREKRYLREIFHDHMTQVTGADVYFFARTAAQVTLYLLEKLVRNNRLVFMQNENQLIDVTKHPSAGIKDLVSLAIMKLTYGRNLGMVKHPAYLRGLPYISDNFIALKVDKVIDLEEGNKMMVDFDLGRFNMLDTSGYSIIYFDDSLVETGYVADKDIFWRELSDIFDILSSHFPPDKIARKYHPFLTTDKAIIRVGEVLPDFIPAELLYNKNVKLYLSVASNSIVNVEEGKVVSLINLVTLSNGELTKRTKESLIQRSHSEILFPQSLDEFERILIDLKGQSDLKR